MLPFGSTIGILGGGQLGRMMAMAAAKLGYHVHIFSPEVDAPAAEVSKYATCAEYSDTKALKAFAESVDIVTLEFENIPLEAANIVDAVTTLYPSPRILEICQHRLKEKMLVNDLGIKTAPFAHAIHLKDAEIAIKTVGTPCVLKTCTMGYDGKGQTKVFIPEDLKEGWDKLNSQDVIVEGWVDFNKEISVIIARNVHGEISYYPPVENIHKNHILHQTIAPADISETTRLKAIEIAKIIATKIDLIGILAIEMFVLKDGSIAVNELAPRPHNSGHWTLDATVINQFELVIRAVSGLPLPSQHNACEAVMTNLIGDDVHHIQQYLDDADCSVHLYGKKEARAGRKMGHVTALTPPHPSPLQVEGVNAYGKLP